MAQYNAYPFQQKAIDEMLDSFKNLWTNNSKTVELTLKAPTGSGKTFMVTHFIDALSRQPDWNEDVAYVWITFSDDLAMQSKDKFYEYFFPTLSNQLLTIADFSQGVLKKNDILFLNWQKLVSRKADDRTLRRPDDTELFKETGFYFEDVAEKTRVEGRQIIMIIDESHKNVTESAYRDVINPLNPKIIVKVSATPEKEPSASQVKNHQAGWVEVNRNDVIEAGLIKKEIISQTEDDLKRYGTEDLDKLMLDLAIEKREQLIRDWKSVGEDINPLILIQLPDDDKDAEARGFEKKETVVTKYLGEKGFTSKEIAVWLSGVPKTDALRTITEKNSPVAFLLFKYAAGTGWDCPRAHILVMYREIKSNTFRTQTLGRILRMPVNGNKISEFPALQIGYLYTNYSRNEVECIPETDENKPKTQVAMLQTPQRAKFAMESFTKRVDDIASSNQSLATKEVFEKTKEKLSNIKQQFEDEINTSAKKSVVSDAEKPSYGEKTESDRKISQIINQCKEVLEDVKQSVPKDEQEYFEGKINDAILRLQDEMRGNKKTNFVLDQALKTEFISRTNYGDLGKSSEFQNSFVNSMNKWFGISEDDAQGAEFLKKKGVDITTTLSQDIMVNARFKTVDESLKVNETTKYEMSKNDVEKDFNNYCYQILKEQDDTEAIIGNAMRSWTVLKTALRSWFKSYALQNYADEGFYKVFLKDMYKGADSKFRPAITQAMKDYYPILQKQLEAKRKKAEEEEPKPFTISTEITCPDDYEKYENSSLSLVDCYLPKTYNGRENETKFIDFLEQKGDYIEWWLKNGTGKDDLGFRYFDSTTKEMRVFYPDWIIKFKDNRIGIFDTKGGITAKSNETKDKAEALAIHISDLNKTSEYKYLGGIVEMRSGVWNYNDSQVYCYEKDWKLFSEIFK